MKTNFRKEILSSLRCSTILTQSVATASMMAVAFGSTGAMALDNNALPTDGKVTGGAATFKQSGAKLNVKQTSNRAVIDWRTYDIGEKAHVNYDQPNSSSIAVNRVSASSNASQINGNLTANGQVWILNANGVMFGRNAKIDVAGLIASTAKINTNKFMAGDNRLVLSKGGRGSVVNEGQITIREGGLAAFVAPHVRNNGVILASLGKVTLAAGETFTLDLAGDQLIEIGLGADTAKAEQLGEIIAAGGTIEISARAAGDLVDAIINLDGVTSAASATIVGGKIILGGDQVMIAGTLDASGAQGGGEISVTGDKITTQAAANIKLDAGESGDGGTFVAYADELGEYSGSFSAQGGAKGGDGGFIETSGKAVKIDDGITVNTLAAAGKTGSWTIDPDNLTVIETGGDGTSTIGANTIVSNLASSSLILKANESITVDAEIDSSNQTNSNTLSLIDENNDGVLTVNLNADINLGSKQSLEGEASTVNITDGADIQDGVDIAVANSQINVAEGEYSEFNTKTNGPENVIITGSEGATIKREASGDIQKVVWLRADGTTLAGFNIDGGGQHVGVAVVGEGITVSNNKIDDVLTGIQTQTAIVEGNNVFTDNSITNAVVGISLQNNSNTVTGNIISVDTKDIVVNGNPVDVPVEAFGIGSSKNVFKNNDVTMGNEGVVIKVYTTADYDALPGGDVDLLNFINNNTLNKGVYIMDGNDVTVQTIFANIQDAVDAASTGNTVEALAGSYAADVSIETSGLTLNGAQSGASAVGRSGDETILTGSIKISGDADGTTIDGLTLAEGSVVEGSKTAIYIKAGAKDTTIQNTIFTRSGDVDGDAYRGILTVSGGDQTGLLIQDNSFSGWATGVYLNPGATGAQVLNNDFNGNYVGMSVDGPSGVSISGNKFRNNKFEGLGLGAGSDPVSATVTNNDFSSNTVNIGLYTGSGTEFDFSGNSFDGVTAESMTVAELSAVAETIKDGTNSADGYSGLARLRDGYVFVTEGGSISDGIGLASTSDIVHVGSGTYSLSSTLRISTSISVQGAGEDSTILDGSAISGYGISVSANNVSLSDFTLYGPVANVSTSYGIKVSPGGAASSRLTDFAISNVTVRGSGRAELDLNGVNGAVITNFTADGRSLTDEAIQTNGAGIQLTDTANVTISGSTTKGNAWGGVAIYQANRSYDQQTSNINIDADNNTFEEANGLYTQDSSDTNNFTDLNLANFDYTVFNSDFRSGGSQFTFYQAKQQAAVDLATSLGSSDSSYILGWDGTANTNVYTVGTGSNDTAMKISKALDTASSGSTIEVLAGTYAEDVIDNKVLAFSFEDTTVNGLTLNTSGSSIQGDITSSGNGITFETAVILDGDTSLTAGAGGINVQKIDGNTAGGQALSMSTTGTVTTDALGSTTRLGTVNVEGAAVNLEGNQYSANNLTFSGPVTLTQTDTEFNTTQSDSAAGDIIFTGNIFGRTNGAQSAAFVAGSGTGEASANGSVSLQNAGTSDTRLGSMTVTANNFNAATVYLEGSFDAAQTGDQTFTQQTLNALGAVSSMVDGTITGPIKSESTVSVTAGQNIDGNITAESVTATATNGSVTGSLEATDGTASVAAATGITGDITGTNVDVTATTIDVKVTATETATVTAVETDGTVGSVKGTVSATKVVVKANEVFSEVTATGTATVTAEASESGAGIIEANVTAKSATLSADDITSNVLVEETATVQAQNTYSGSVEAETVVVDADNIEADVIGQTVTVTAENDFTGSVEAESATIESKTIDAEVSGGTIKIESETGTVDGEPDNLDTGDGILKVNDEVVLGESEAEVKQYVVEGFELPADAYITETGAIILPDGFGLAAISPAGGGTKPKIIMVHDVKSLGELLEAGYTAIIINLNQSTLVDNQEERSLDSLHTLTDVDA
ncbi:MAG: filamentous hemagglutinin N-terminal domain-containing protein [Sneathiella sp.]|uniref:two-partner secretion domain-containing protein n=1 Tax=Sneathiella sp. TaxID=1964365 RepID=UPI0030038492